MRINVEIVLTLFGVPTSNAIPAVKAIRSFCCVGLKEVGQAVFMARNTVSLNGEWVSTHATVGLLKLEIDKRFIGALFDRLAAANAWFTIETSDGTMKLSSFIDHEDEAKPVKPIAANMSWLR